MHKLIHLLYNLIIKYHRKQSKWLWDHNNLSLWLLLTSSVMEISLCCNCWMYVMASRTKSRSDEVGVIWGSDLRNEDISRLCPEWWYMLELYFLNSFRALIWLGDDNCLRLENEWLLDGDEGYVLPPPLLNLFGLS